MVPYYEVVRNNHNLPKLLKLKEIDFYRDNGGVYEAAQLLKAEFHLGELNSEYVYLATFDDSWKMSIFLIGVGTTDECYIYKKKIALDLLLSGADSFCLFHNHPSQRIIASESDLITNNEMKELAALLELDYLGNYIMIKQGYVNVEDNMNDLVNI